MVRNLVQPIKSNCVTYFNTVSQAVLALPCLSVRPSLCRENSASIGRIFMEFDTYFSEMCHENPSTIKITQKITGTSLEGQYTFLIISSSFLLRMRNVSDKG